MIYLLTYTSPDRFRKDTYILEGRQVENWRDFCQSLLSQAAQETLKEHKYLEKADPEQQDFVGWHNIIATLCMILQRSHGYTLLDPDEMKVSGKYKIDKDLKPSLLPDDVLEDVIEYNQDFLKKKTSEDFAINLGEE